MSKVSFLIVVVFAVVFSYFTPYVIESYTKAHKQTKEEIHQTRPRGTIKNL